MSSLRDDTRRLEREILDTLARAGGSDDDVFGALVRAFALLCANGNAGIASLTGHGEGVAVLAAHPVPPAFTDEAWPADAALATLVASDGGASAPLGTTDFWLAAVGVAPGRHHLSGIAIRADDGTALGVLFTVGAIDTAFAASPLLPLLRQRAARELQARQRQATQHSNLLLYRSAAQIAGCRVLVHDRGGILRDVSPGDSASWPCSRELIVGRHFSESIPPGPAELFANAQRGVFDSGETWTGEYAIELPDGTRWREIRVAAFDRDHTLAVIRDITDARLALQALRDSEMHQRAIVEALPDTLLVNDADGVYVEAPVVSAGAWRYDTIDALGKRFADVLPAPVANLFTHGQATVLATGEPCQGEYAIEVGGSTRWREFHMVRLDARRTLTIVRDVTALKLALASLRDSESRLRNVVRLAPVGIFWTDPDGAVLYGNPALQRTIQLRAEEGLGHAWIEQVHAADRPQVLDAWRGLLDGRRQEFNEEYRFVPPGRPACVVRTHAVPIVSGGRLIGLIGIVLDITAQRHAEEQARQLQLRLQHTQKLEALGQLTGGIAHEFNNILATTLGYAALAQRRPDGDGKLVHYMQQIVTAGERGRDLVNQMLTFVQRPADRGAALDPIPVLNDACQMLRSALPPGIELVVDLQTQRLVVASDAGDLRQVLLNLVFNARDAVGTHGSIHVTLLGPQRVRGACRTCQEPLDDDYVTLRVHDSGRGIAAPDLGRIFDPFYTTREVGSGAGLGLSVVHGIVHRDGGHVLVDSSPARGTTFDILLKPKPVAPANAPTATKRRRRTTAWIAVVDDEPTVGGLIRELLEADGYGVDLFTSGEDALAAITDAPQRHALLVTDLTMPRMSGLELAVAVRALRPTLPIVMCTGYHDAVERGASKVPGIAHWCRKPLPIGDFLHIISQLTGTPMA